MRQLRQSGELPEHINSADVAMVEIGILYHDHKTGFYEKVGGVVAADIYRKALFDVEKLVEGSHEKT